MPSSFTSNMSGWRRLLKASGAAEIGAHTVERNAQGIAPVLTGRYRDSIHVEAHDGEATVVADVPYARKLEAKYNTLGKSIHP